MPESLARYVPFGAARVGERVTNLAESASAGDLYALHSDHLGSVSLATDAWGMTVTLSLARYFPFGAERGTPPSGSPTDFGHATGRGFGIQQGQEIGVEIRWGKSGQSVYRLRMEKDDAFCWSDHLWLVPQLVVAGRSAMGESTGVTGADRQRAAARKLDRHRSGTRYARANRQPVRRTD